MTGGLKEPKIPGERKMSRCFFSHHAKCAVLIATSMTLTACGGGGGGGSTIASSTVASSGGSVSAYYPRSPVGTLVPAPPITGNVLPVAVDAGPVPGTSQINIAYVSVTVCIPGTSGTSCQTIDHVQLDTGSSGLRLLNSALYANLNLPTVTQNGKAVGECTPFAIGTTWGSVLSADIYLAGEVARSVPVQIIGDRPGGALYVPQDCVNTGALENNQTQLGANGILGVGLFINDCIGCQNAASPIPAAYYTCTTAGCTNATVTTVQMVTNPVALFTTDNNGELIDFPQVPTGGLSGLPGSLIFGIDTQSNNQLGSAIKYATDTSGNFSTTFNGSNTSYIDSGSNGLFFYDANIPACQVNTWAYCPAPSPMSLSAINIAASGTPSGTVNFSIESVDQLGTGIIAANIAGLSTAGQFSWGLPFFFGRKVFTYLSHSTTPTGSSWAY